jgi:threonine dehydratase
LQEGAEVDPAAVRSAAARIAGRVHRTPVRTSATLDGRTGAQVLIKDEAVQKTGSFKVRGALNRLLTLPTEALDRGLVAVTAGNHGAAVAWAAAQVGAKATVVMPTYSPAAKVAACWSYGAEVVLHGDTTGEAFAECARLQRERGLTFVHPFDDPEIVAGQGTVGLELVTDAGSVDVWIVSVGGGGLICGSSLAVREASPGCRVVGVEPEGAAALSAALAAGEPVPIVPRSVADGLCAPFAGPLTFPLFRQLVDEVVLVSEAELLAGVRFVLQRMKVVVEPAGAATVAALLAGKAGPVAGRRVGTVLTGGNVDLGAVVPQLPGASEG